jgi:POT family proton-dependent oligopeptide transporter
MTEAQAAKQWSGHPRVKERHPKGLYVLFATEMWERFSFYTVFSMLVLYLKDAKQGFGWSTAEATSLYSTYLLFVFGSPLLGGWLADRKIGYRRAITIGGVFFVAGHLLLAFPTLTVFYIALTCLVIGNGLFKPNVSTIVGTLYPEGSHLKDSGFNIFYMGINIGAAAAPIVAEAVKKRYGFHPAFATAAGGMVLAMIIFWGLRRFIVPASERPPQPDEDAVATTESMPPVPPTEHSLETSGVSERTRVLALLVILTMAIVFWMIFWQNGSTLTLWANDNTDWASSAVLPVIIRIVSFGFVKGNDVSGIISNSINPIFIILLSPVVAWLWQFLDRRGRDFRTTTKMFLGMLFTCFSPFLLYVAAKSGGDTGRVSPWWLIASYFFISLAEVLVSPMGLSLVSKVAPPRMRGALMGAWFLSISLGGKLTVIGKYWTVWSHSQFFLLLTIAAAATAVLFMAVLPPLRRAMPGA